MTKKRKHSGSSPVKVEIKEENAAGNDYLMAKGRLQGVLKQLTEQSSDEGSEDDTKTRKGAKFSKNKNEQIPLPYHHTYVMKLYDRSVDLAKFEEDTPLYPLCRAWMENQPKNPQAIVKRRLSSPDPEPVNQPWNTVNVNCLPPPSKPYETRIPSPLSEQEQNKDNINLDYDECPPVDKQFLIRNHLQRWTKIKKKWMETSSKNEERFSQSFSILETIHMKAQEAQDNKEG